MTHHIHNRHISMLPAEFEPTISAGERLQTYALDRSVTGTGERSNRNKNIWTGNFIAHIPASHFNVIIWNERNVWQWCVTDGRTDGSSSTNRSFTLFTQRCKLKLFVGGGCPAVQKDRSHETKDSCNFRKISIQFM